MNNIIDYDLLSIQEARILSENAKTAQKKLLEFSQSRLDKIVNAMIEGVRPYAEELAKKSAYETDYGNWEDKCIKNKYICEYLPRALDGMKCVGILSEDKEKLMIEIGVPLGVIVALCPATSPVSTTIYKVAIAIKSGNSIVFSLHPRAKETMKKVLDILIEEGEKAGLPAGSISYLETSNKKGALALMEHEDVAMIINTGVPKLLTASLESKKPVIYGGNGSGPAFVERSCDIDKAVKDIITSKIFDYGIVSASEQSIVVDKAIEDKVRQALIKENAYFMTEDESNALSKVLYDTVGNLNSEAVGKSAKVLSQKAGFKVKDETTVLISEEKYVSLNNPYSKEKLSPVLAYYVEDDWRNACEKCIELLIGEKEGHTLVIHSNDEEVIREFALKKPVARVLVNTPAVFGSMGVTTNLFPAMSLGSGSAGIGITSDNVSPQNLTYIRKVGYYSGNKIDKLKDHYDNCIKKENKKEENIDEILEGIHKLLKEALNSGLK